MQTQASIVTAKDIETIVQSLFNKVAETTMADVSATDTEKQNVRDLSLYSLTLLSGLLVDIHRIADALETLAGNSSETPTRHVYTDT